MSNHQKHTSLVNTFASQLKMSFVELKSGVSDSEIEDLAIFLIRTMGTDSRDYHRPEHSLDVSKVESPIARLAAFFHDLIYVQVDPTWRALEQMLHPFVPDDLCTLNVSVALKRNSDPWLKGIAVMFGVENESNLTPAKGLNEFLSAVVMYRKLSLYLEPMIMFRALACIVATVPFLGIDAEGKNPAQRMVMRLKDAVSVLDLPEYNDNFYDFVVADCTQIVSTDLASFGAADFSHYVSNTWNVMYESYPPLRNMYFYISEYRKAVYGNIHFLGTLDSTRLYWDAYAKKVDPDLALVERTQYNLKMGQIYLKTFGVSLSVLEAIAQVTGGDAPYEMFVGPIKRSREHNPRTIHDFLESPKEFEGNEEDRLIYQVLKEGRNFRARFDNKDCPVGAFLFYHLKRDKVLALYESALKFHQGASSPEAFLKLLPASVLNEITQALTHMVLTRQEELGKWVLG